MNTCRPVHYLLLVTILTFLPIWQTQAAEEVGKGTLAFKPVELLPENTRDEEIGIRVRLEPAPSPNFILVSAPNKEYKNVVTVRMDDRGNFAGLEPLHWSKGAIHEIAKNMSFAGYGFKPENNSVLIFRVEPGKGYVFVSGQGEVTTPEKGSIVLEDSKGGLVLGHPARPKQVSTTEPDKSHKKPNGEGR